VQVFDYPSVAALTTFVFSKLPVTTARTSAARAAATIALAAPVKQLVSLTQAAPTSSIIAVTGMSCRLPGAQHSSYSLQAVDSIQRIPYNRWDVMHASQQVSELQASFGSFLSGVAGFDAAAFGLPEAEALLMDPQQRQLMEVSWESLGRALAAANTAGNGGVVAYRAACGVFVGVSSRDYFTLGKDYSQVRRWCCFKSQLAAHTCSLRGCVREPVGMCNACEEDARIQNSQVYGLHKARSSLAHTLNKMKVGRAHLLGLTNGL
jgi:hypothetical protein